MKCSGASFMAPILGAKVDISTACLNALGIYKEKNSNLIAFDKVTLEGLAFDQNLPQIYLFSSSVHLKGCGLRTSVL